MKVFEYLSKLLLLISVTLLSILTIWVSITIFVFEIDNSFTVMWLKISCVLAIIIIAILLSWFVIRIVNNIKKIAKG